MYCVLFELHTYMIHASMQPSTVAVGSIQSNSHSLQFHRKIQKTSHCDAKFINSIHSFNFVTYHDHITLTKIKPDTMFA